MLQCVTEHRHYNQLMGLFGGLFSNNILEIITFLNFIFVILQGLLVFHVQNITRLSLWPVCV